MLWGLHGDRDQPQQLAVVPGAAGAQGERGARRHRLQVQQPAVDRTVGLGGGDRTDRPGDRDVVQHAAVDHLGGPFRPGRLGHRLAEDAVHVPWEGFAAAGRLGVVVVGGGPDGGRLERSRVGGCRPAGVGQPAHRLPRVRPPAGPVPQGVEVAHRALLQVAEPEVGTAAGVPDGIPDRLVEGLRRRVQQGGGEDQVDTAPPQPRQPLPLRARLAGLQPVAEQRAQVAHQVLVEDTVALQQGLRVAVVRGTAQAQDVGHLQPQVTDAGAEGHVVQQGAAEQDGVEAAGAGVPASTSTTTRS